MKMARVAAAVASGGLYRNVPLHSPEEDVAERLLTYALGRGVEYYDGPAIRAIVRQAAIKDYKFSSLVIGIVNSTPFQMRRAR